MKFIRLAVLGALFVGMLFAICSHASAQSQKLNLYIWSEYLDPALVSRFEAEHHCKISIDLYEDAESMLAKIQNGGLGLYDVVVPPDHLVPAMIKLNLLAPLDQKKIPNIHNIASEFQDPVYDRSNRFTVPYQWGTVGIYVRRSPNAKIEPTWGLIFDPKQQTGPFLLIDSMRDLMGAALKYKGWSINSTDPSQLKVARDLIVESKKRCAGMDGSVGAKNKVLGKSARAAIVYSGEGFRGMTDDTETIYLLPREGTQIWVDNLAIPARAPHSDLAHAFLNFILDAKVGAQLSNFTQYSSPNRAALAFIKPEDLANPVLYPREEVKAKLEFLKDLGGKNRLYDEIWTQIKSK